ncbi:MAG TPA: enoyl-CoA hydratase [Marmoricola sp.]|nr:enoyl-CoA hydratase [Marmoricola sp.]
MDPQVALPAGGEDVQVRVEGGALRLTLTRPDRLNALSEEMTRVVTEALEAAVSLDEVRCVVVTGSGGSFSAGADVAGEAAHERFDVRALDAANRLARAVTTLDKPVVASVNGIAAGVGCSLALACDLVVAARSAQFLLAFTRLGLMPDGGTSWTVAASVGRARAMRMALLAEPMSAQEAYDAGLASHLVEDEDLDGLVAQLVRRLTSGPPLAFAATKKAVNAATLAGLHDALERERVGQTVLLRTEDAAEGMRAFGEKRRPTFRGR